MKLVKRPGIVVSMRSSGCHDGSKVSDRVTIRDLQNGPYQHADHHRLGDRGMRRYHPFSFDFDSTPLELVDENEAWDEPTREARRASRARLVERLKDEHGSRDIEQVVANVRDLGPKSMSLISYHNQMHQQCRKAFVVGAYYPALVGACALGERILNHLVLDLRGAFTSSPHYKRVYRKKSLDDWPFAVSVLSDWQVLADGAGAKFLELADLRNRSIHFNAETYESVRDDALAALQCLGRVISIQFGYFGSQPWFISNTPGAQFVKREYEAAPFVRTYIVPRSGFVGPLYGMEIGSDGLWRHLDYADYGDGVLSDEDFATATREREPTKVVTREMIELELQARRATAVE